jgi:hypothetical protein
MGFLVVATAQLQCSMGLAPSVLTVIRPNITADHKPAANIQDNKPMVNVAPFGMCNSTSNPQVIAATAAASGVHTPMPCVPNTTAPWTPGAVKVKVQKQPALSDSCKLMCMWAGQISITNPGQQKVKVT